jgi:glycogen operon protein
VSYNEKHNVANKEDSRDGSNDNHSWNCGVEGPTDDPAIDALRLKQIKNCLTILFFSQGTPMLWMGDEVRRSQQGNNNAYCQDNELSWFDWSSVKKEAGLLRFVQTLIHFTRSLESFRHERLLEVSYASQKPHVVWHSTELGQPNWSEHSHCLAFTLRHPEAAEHFHVMLNAYWDTLTFELPPLGKGERWYRIIDTALPSPKDITEPTTAPQVRRKKYAVEARSSVVLMARIG